MNRRQFTNMILAGGALGWLASLVYPLLAYLKPPKVREANVSSIKVGSASQFPANTAKIVKFGREPLIVLRTAGGEFRAMTATCTHLQCIVQYRPDLKLVWCACHNGLYDTHGRNISGPPPRPLTEYPIAVVNDEIVVSKPS